MLVSPGATSTCSATISPDNGSSTRTRPWMTTISTLAPMSRLGTE
jgi:hypothetical protein